MMSPCRGDGDRALGGFLTLHVTIVNGIVPELGDRVCPTEWMRRNFQLTTEEADRFCQRSNRNHIDPLHYRGFAGIRMRNDQSRQAEFFGFQGHRKRPFGGTDRAIQC